MTAPDDLIARAERWFREMGHVEPVSLVPPQLVRDLLTEVRRLRDRWGDMSMSMEEAAEMRAELQRLRDLVTALHAVEQEMRRKAEGETTGRIDMLDWADRLRDLTGGTR